MNFFESMLATFLGALIGLIMGAFLNIWVAKVTAKGQIELQLKINTIKELEERLNQCRKCCSRIDSYLRNKHLKVKQNVNLATGPNNEQDSVIYNEIYDIIALVSSIESYLTSFSFLADYKNHMDQFKDKLITVIKSLGERTKVESSEKQARKILLELSSNCNILSNSLIKLLPQL